MLCLDQSHVVGICSILCVVKQIAWNIIYPFHFLCIVFLSCFVRMERQFADERQSLVKRLLVYATANACVRDKAKR